MARLVDELAVEDMLKPGTRVEVRTSYDRRWARGFEIHEVGESQESLPVAYTGDVLEIGFNADFLRDGLELLDSDDVRVKLISPLRPAVIQGEGDDFRYLVMPIRLPG